MDYLRRNHDIHATVSGGTVNSHPIGTLRETESRYNIDNNNTLPVGRPGNGDRSHLSTNSHLMRTQTNDYSRLD
jgi:hypothetical protein